MGDGAEDSDQFPKDGGLKPTSLEFTNKGAKPEEPKEQKIQKNAFARMPCQSKWDKRWLLEQNVFQFSSDIWINKWINNNSDGCESIRKKMDYMA